MNLKVVVPRLHNRIYPQSKHLPPYCLSFCENGNTFIFNFFFFLTALQKALPRLELRMPEDSCCEGCRVGPDKECVKTLHVSCASDQRDSTRCNNEECDVHNMVGMCLYLYKGKTDWTLNNHHCKKGYILIKKTCNIKKISSSQGAVHGKLYKWFFEEEPDSDVVATGFAIKGGEWIFRSGVFNKSGFNREAFPKERRMIRQAVENFWTFGCQNTPFGT